MIMSVLCNEPPAVIHAKLKGRSAAGPRTVCESKDASHDPDLHSRRNSLKFSAFLSVSHCKDSEVVGFMPVSWFQAFRQVSINLS